MKITSRSGNSGHALTGSRPSTSESRACVLKAIIAASKNTRTLF